SNGGRGRVAERRCGLRRAVLRDPAPETGHGADGLYDARNVGCDQAGRGRVSPPEPPDDADAGDLEATGAARLRAAASTEELAEAETAVLGKRSALAEARAALAALDHEERKSRGSQLNDARTRLHVLADERRAALAGVERRAG